MKAPGHTITAIMPQNQRLPLFIIILCCVLQVSPWQCTVLYLEYIQSLVASSDQGSADIPAN